MGKNIDFSTNSTPEHSHCNKDIEILAVKTYIFFLFEKLYIRQHTFVQKGN